MLGTVVNAGCVIVGSIVGSLLKKGINEKYTQTLFSAMGLASLALGASTFAANLRLQGMAYEAKGEDSLAIQAYRAYLEKNPKGEIPDKYADALVGE